VIRAVVAAIVLAAGVFAATACDGEDRPLEHVIEIHFSRFDPETITVPAGKPVTFTLRNNDPIEHEWIVGPEEIHEAHRTGDHALHDAIPTEVTLPAFSVRLTTVTFAEKGEFAFICHLPGHEEYGMRGLVRVR
jgi:uncharacterized cupredoxin-like copper-binding protein